MRSSGDCGGVNVKVLLLRSKADSSDTGEEESVRVSEQLLNVKVLYD